MMNNDPIIVPVSFNDWESKINSISPSQKETLGFQFKLKDAEATFYNGVDKHILHAIFSEMSKHAR